MNFEEVCFLFVTPALQGDVQKYSLLELQDIGIQVIIADFSSLVAPKRSRSVTAARLCTDGIKSVLLHTWEEAEYFIAKRAEHTFFFPMFDINYESRMFFRLFTRYRVTYGFVNNLASEIDAETKECFSAMISWFRFQKLNSVLYNRLLRKIIPLKKASFLALGSDNRVDDFFNRGCCDKHTKKVFVHTYDYERFLRTPSYESTEDYCVMLDQFFPYHPDITVDAGCHVEADAYFREMNEILDRIRRETGLKTIIAAHPRANYEEKPFSYSDDCEITYGKTSELVKGAKLVLAHYSTAISFAIMAKKPVVLLCPPELEKFGKRYCEAYRDTFGFPMWSGVSDVNTLGLYDVDSARYENYMNQYIKCSNDAAADKPLWEAILQEIPLEKGTEK